MNPADRIALIERLARARAWNVLSPTDRTELIRRVDADLAEIEISQEQIQRIGWMLVEVERGDAEQVT